MGGKLQSKTSTNIKAQIFIISTYNMICNFVTISSVRKQRCSSMTIVHGKLKRT
jgi:hypothetical protein